MTERAAAAAGASARVPSDCARSDASPRELMLRDVLAGLALPRKELSPKYFYDTRGSELFEEITATDEYYPTRRERALLERWGPVWVEELQPAALVELGAGSAAKSRVLLDAMEEHGTGNLYVPVDVSADFLHETALQLRTEYDDLQVEPAVADITAPVELPVELPEPSWCALLGSTIGNFTEAQAGRLLRRVSRGLRPADRFLLGVDLRPGPHKSRERIERAYNDAAGLTAAFNLNVLRVLNRELGCDFDENAYRHRAFYDRERSRIEIHLVALRDQSVRFPGGPVVRVEAGECILTELSHKYDRASVDNLFAASGMAIDRWVEDEDRYFALALGRPAGARVRRDGETPSPDGGGRRRGG